MQQDWEVLERIFGEALDLPEANRLQFVKEQSGDNLWLLNELQTLLQVPESKADQAFNPRSGILRELLTALDTEFTVGRQIGGYRIESLISSTGGMGVVYRAVQIASGDPVALKLLPPEDSENPRRIRRLAREALALRSLDHPGVVKIRDYLQQPGCHCIVMELVDGVTLQGRLADGPIALDVALDWAEQIAEAMEAAHAQGVAHRDLKPANIMIERASGRLKVLDFGLALLADRELSTHTRTTVDGAVCGTFSYFSPEQASGESGDERSDIFSFGALLYEMISGRRAFDRPGAAATAAAVLTARPHPLPAATPQPVRALIHRCLEKHPAQRVSTMSEIRAEVGRLRALKRRGRLKPARSNRARLGIAAVLALTAIAAGWAVSNRRQTPPARFSIAVLPFTNANGDPAIQYLADSLTEEFTNELTRVTTLRVAPRASAALFREPPRDLLGIGRQIGASHLLEAGVERTGDRIVIVASLRQASDGANLWTNTYRRPAADLAAIETDLEEKVVTSLGLAASALPKRHVPPEQAHEFYLKASFEADQIALDSNTLAQQDYRRALELDPDYTLAYAGLGAAIWNRANAAGEPVAPETLRESEQLWRKALQLDPGLAKAHVALAMFAMRFDWDWNRAERELQAALSLGPSSGTEMNFASLCLILGRRREADDHFRYARDLVPLSSQAALNFAEYLALEGRFDEAREEVRKIAIQHPAAVRLQIRLNYLDAWLGKPGPAIENLRKWSRQQPFAGQLLAKVEAHHGNTDEALRILRPLERNYQDGHLVMTWAAEVYALMDDEANAVKWLERAIDAREDEVAGIHIDPAFAKMQNKPTFRALKRRMGLDW